MVRAVKDGNKVDSTIPRKEVNMPRPDTAPTLETERLVLRAHRVSDFAESAAMWADPSVVRYISGTPSTPETSWSRLLRHAGHWRLLGFGYWAVETRAGEFVGEVGLADYRRDALLPPRNGVPEAGWVLKAAQHGKGFASEAARCALAWADANLEAPATVCLLNPGHVASIHVARKLGYGGDEPASYQGKPALVLSRDRHGECHSQP